MFHFGAIALSVVMALGIGVMPVRNTETEKDEPIYYENTGGIYGQTTSSAYSTVVKVPYTSKTLTANYNLSYRRPTLTFAPAVGCCGAIAGGNVVAFYDRYDENLIPNHVSGTSILNTFAYNIGDQYTDATITQLYEYMAGGNVGMTKEQFKSGLTRFCAEKGKSVSFDSCMFICILDHSKLQACMQANQPVVFFLRNYNVLNLYSGENSDSLAYYVSTTSHIMVGFGYKSYSYETSTGTRIFDFVTISSGLTGSGYSDLFDIRNKTIIDDALAVNIF